MSRRVVITGMGVVAPNGVGLEAYERALRNGTSGIRHFPLLDELKFACTVGGAPEGVDEIAEEYFDEDERRAFDISDAAEWAQRITNGVVRRLTPQEARQVPRERISKVPMHIGRTSRSREVGELVAKSRATLPGHVDPNLGAQRTDSPTTQPVAISLLMVTLASLRWKDRLFDVCTAFLSGK